MLNAKEFSKSGNPKEYILRFMDFGILRFVIMLNPKQISKSPNLKIRNLNKVVRIQYILRFMDTGISRFVILLNSKQISKSRNLKIRNLTGCAYHFTPIIIIE